MFERVEEAVRKYTADVDFIKYISDRLVVRILSGKGDENEKATDG